MTAGATRLRPATDADVAQISSWSYVAPFDLYDGDGDAAGLPLPDAEGHGYYVCEDDAGVLAFVCFGPEGRVAGQEPDDAILDVGMGVRPDAVSSGVATSLIGEVVTMAAGVFGAQRVRTAVAAFNERSLALCRAAGLAEARRFEGPQGREFVEMAADVWPARGTSGGLATTEGT